MIGGIGKALIQMELLERHQAPLQCTINGTRRWVTPGQTEAVKAELRQLLDDLAQSSGTQIEADFEVPGDAFRIDEHDPLVVAFQAAYGAITGGPLVLGNKPFVDDGNVFIGLAGIPALTHGPNATGAHTLNEAAPIAELVRVAQVYALTAIGYCVS